MRSLIGIAVLFSGSLLVASACSDSGDGDGGGGSGDKSSSGSDCEKLCERAESIDCAESDCVDECETELPSCDAEFRDVVSCSADAETVGCVNGKIAADGCDSENAALLECLTTGSGGSGAGGAPTGTTCEKLCGKASDAGCEPADCVAQCDTMLPKCDAEFDAFNTCVANTGSVTCAPDGDPEVSGCDAEEQAMSDCLLGGGGSCYEGHGDCDPLSAGSCGGGQGCYLTDQNDFACFSPGPTGVGGACRFADDCGPDLVCAEDSQGTARCHSWCCDDNDCGGASCVSYGAAGTIDVKLCAQ